LSATKYVTCGDSIAGVSLQHDITKARGFVPEVVGDRAAGGLPDTVPLGVVDIGDFVGRAAGQVNSGEAITRVPGVGRGGGAVFGLARLVAARVDDKRVIGCVEISIDCSQKLKQY